MSESAPPSLDMTGFQGLGFFRIEARQAWCHRPLRQYRKRGTHSQLLAASPKSAQSSKDWLGIHAWIADSNGAD